MIWQEFLDLLKKCKKEKLQKIDAGSLSTLLYAGALNAIIGYDPGYEELITKAEEIRHALKSEAQPKEAKKNELFGIVDIDSEVKLQLWRHQVTPLTSFYLYDFFQNALMHFNLCKMPESSPFVYANSSIHVWPSFKSIVDNPRVSGFYLQQKPPQTAALVGMVESVTMHQTKAGKEFMKFNFFTGIDYLTIMVWAEKNGKVHEQLRESIQPKSYGLAILRLNDYKGTISANLIQWNKIRC
jgi:hypothetical protein